MVEHNMDIEKAHRRGLKTMGISIIMPVYDGADSIRKSLPPLLDLQGRGEVVEVLVVDDSSTDASPEIARTLGAKVIPSGGRMGPGAARNKAANLAAGEILWFVDADVVIHDDAITCIQEGFTSGNVVALFGCYDDKPPAQNFLSQYKNLVHHYYHNRGRREASTFWAGCGAVRKQVFLKVGGFDVNRNRNPSIEDIELGYRLRSAGGEIILTPDLKCTHLKVWKFVNLIHTEVFCRAIPWSRLALEQANMPDDLNVSIHERLRAALAGIFLLGLIAIVAQQIPLWSALILALAMSIANYDLLSLFYRKNGLLFAVSGLAFHQLYYLYSSSAFVYCWLEFRIKAILSA